MQISFPTYEDKDDNVGDDYDEGDEGDGGEDGGENGDEDDDEEDNQGDGGEDRYGFNKREKSSRNLIIKLIIHRGTLHIFL